MNRKFTLEEVAALEQSAISAERERIRQNILTRVTDLNYCTKRDNCNEFARLIDSYIEEWLDGENE